MMRRLLLQAHRSQQHAAVYSRSTVRTMSVQAPTPSPPQSSPSSGGITTTNSNNTGVSSQVNTNTGNTPNKNRADRRFRLILAADNRVLLLSVAVIIASLSSVYHTMKTDEREERARQEKEMRQIARQQKIQSVKDSAGSLLFWRRKNASSTNEDNAAAKPKE